MEFYQLEHFVAVVEEHSFTRAAERVFRTQGAVSVAIRKLEEELGVPLMLRDSRECVLTEAGEAFLDYARRMIELRNAMRRTMRDFGTLAVGCVRIASHESAAEYLLPAPLAEFYRRHPNIRLEARLCDGHEIAHLVSEREVDLGFGIQQTSVHGLRCEVVHNDPLVLVAAPGHRLERRSGVTLADLGDERFFIHSRHTTTVLTVQRLFAEHLVPFQLAAELWNFETIKQFVRTGGGIAILPASVVKADIHAGCLVTIAVEELNLPRPIEITYRANTTLLPTATVLLELLRQWPWGGASHAAADIPGGLGEPPLRPEEKSGKR
jgi:DNA-binding transcriptional LysR family regulator